MRIMKIDCGMVQCVILSAIDVAFTPMNVLRAVQEVKDTDLLGKCLCVPNSKRGEIYAQFSSVLQQRKSLIQYWMERDPEASWRGLIVALDKIEEKKAADVIRYLAEPIIGIVDCRDWWSSMKSVYLFYIVVESIRPTCLIHALAP